MNYRSVIVFPSLIMFFISLVLSGCGGGGESFSATTESETPSNSETDSSSTSIFIQQASGDVAQDFTPSQDSTTSINTQNQVVVFVHGNAGGLPISDISSLGSDFGSDEETEFAGNWCSDGITPLSTTSVGLAGSWLGKWLMDDGYDVWVAHYTSNTETTDSIVNNAACIGRQISDVAKYDADGQVTIIAASLGGLVSRYYLEGEAVNYPYQNDVERLFTLGTPNKGMPIDVLVNLGLIDCDTSPAFCEVKRASIKAFNQSHERAEGVVYNFIGGAAPIENMTGNFRIIASAMSVLGTNDGLALTNSALGRKGNIFDYKIKGTLGRFETDESHGPGIGLNSYFTPRTDAEGTLVTEFSTAYTGCIKPQLAGEIVYCEN